MKPAFGESEVSGGLADSVRSSHLLCDLRRSEERHRLLAENAWDVVWTMALDGSITYVSPAIERVRGITASEAMAQTPDQVNPPSSAAIVAEYFSRLFAAINNGSELPEFRGELEYYRADGSIMVGELQVMPHVGSDGKVVEILGVTRDISERKLREAAEARYRRLLNNSAIGMAVFTPDGQLEAVNQAMCDFFGYDADTLRTKTWQELTAPEYLEADSHNVNEVLAGRIESYRMKKLYIHADGNLIWGDLSVSCLRTPSGDVESFLAQIIDITAEVEMLEQLAERDERNRLLARRLQVQAERLAAELNSAAAYVSSILPGDLEGPVRVSSRYLPSEELAGDSFDYRWIDDDHLIVYLIDVSGHGVEPALLSVSVHNLLRSGSLPLPTLLAPEKVLAELNRLFQMDQHGEHYLTMWFGVYEASSRTLRYASAGHPPAFAATPDTASATTELATGGQPLGMFGDTVYTQETYIVPPGCRILLFSDGAYEDAQADGRRLSLTDFKDLYTRRAGSSLDELVDTLRSLTPSGSFGDDCSLVRLEFD